MCVLFALIFNYFLCVPVIIKVRTGILHSDHPTDLEGVCFSNRNCSWTGLFHTVTLQSLSYLRNQHVLHFPCYKTNQPDSHLVLQKTPSIPRSSDHVLQHSQLSSVYPVCLCVPSRV